MIDIRKQAYFIIITFLKNKIKSMVQYDQELCDMFWIILLAAVLCLIVFLYYFMTAGKPVRSWLEDYAYAHRGLHTGEFPENSLAAFQNAVDHGYAIELDVHLSRDEVLVVFHDESLKRMTGFDGRIEDLTLEELRTLRLAGTQHGIPTLQEVFDTVDGKVPLLIELKNVGRAGKLEMALFEALSTYRGKYAVQSFSPFSVRWFRKNAPGVLRGQLSATFSQYADEFPKWKRRALKHLIVNAISRPNFINYELDGLEMPVIKRLRKRGIPIFAWTVRTGEEEERALKYADVMVFENIEVKNIEK